MRVPNAPAVHRALLDRGVLAGLVLAGGEPGDASLADGLLVCATEVTTTAEIARFAEALSAELGGTAEAARSAGSRSERQAAGVAR